MAQGTPAWRMILNNYLIDLTQHLEGTGYARAATHKKKVPIALGRGRKSVSRSDWLQLVTDHRQGMLLLVTYDPRLSILRSVIRFLNTIPRIHRRDSSTPLPPPPPKKKNAPSGHFWSPKNFHNLLAKAVITSRKVPTRGSSGKGTRSAAAGVVKLA